MVQHIKGDNPVKKSKGIGMVTNGWLLNEANIAFLKEYDVNPIAISLDGEEKIHDHIRQTPGSFKRIMDNIKICQAHDLPVSVISSINKINLNIRDTLAEIVSQLGVAQWQVQIVNSFGRAGMMKEQIVIDHSQYVQFIDDIAVRKEKYRGRLDITVADSIGYCHPQTDYLLGGEEWSGCNAGLYVLGIESNGNVKGCLSLQDDIFIAGNVREKSITDIWKEDDSFSYTRKYDPEKLEGNCKTCSYGSQCKAGCLGMAYSIHHSIYTNSYCYKQIKEQMHGNA